MLIELGSFTKALLAPFLPVTVTKLFFPITILCNQKTIRAGTNNKNDIDAPPWISNKPVICKYACVGKTGNDWPPNINGVAKSARDELNNNKIEFPIAGIESGKVIVFNTLLFDAPKDIAASSKDAFIVFRTADITIKATGKYVKDSLSHVPRKPYMLRFSIPKNLNNIPLGPKARVNEILLVKGGDINGNKVMALIKIFNTFGTDVLVTIKANKYPKIVPLTLTLIARIRELNKALIVYLSAMFSLIPINDNLPSIKNAEANNLIKGNNINKATNPHIAIMKKNR